MNSLVSGHVSAVSPKRNTTRHTITGVSTHDHIQLVLYDTPGINALKHSKLYERELSVSAWTTLPSADIALLLIDAAKQLTDAEYELIERAKQYTEQHIHMKLVLVLNKVDLFHTLNCCLISNCIPIIFPVTWYCLIEQVLL